MKKYVLLFSFIAFINIGFSQTYKFGKVSKKELTEKFYPQDTTANAVVLYKEEISSFEYDKNRGFYIKTQFFARIKIYNKDGFDYATHFIPLYQSPKLRETVLGLKAVTYNLENGKIVKTKLSKKRIIKEKTTEHYSQVKFTMPNIKPGSVVEWKYQFETPFIQQMNDVVIQEDIPVKNIFVKVKIPEFFGYRPKLKGFLPITVNKTSNTKSLVFYNRVYKTAGFGMGKRATGEMDVTNISYTENVYLVKEKNIPALPDEPFSGNINNYRSALVMELLYIETPNGVRENFTVTWEDVANKIYLKTKFGGQLKKKNYFKNDLKQFLTFTGEDKLKAIFEFVKHKIKWNKEKDYLCRKGVIQAYRKGEGNSAEVNLNLINMLNAAGFETYPVLVSTVDYGEPIYPTLTGFNYVIAAVKKNNDYILLDATDLDATLNILPERVLNFMGRLIKNDGTSQWLQLFPKKNSNEIITVNLSVNDDENLSGLLRTKYKDYFAYNMRKKYKGKRQEEIEKLIREENSDLEIEKLRINNLDKPYKPVSKTIKFETDAYIDAVSGKLYITPLVNLAFEANPFKSPKRKFPVFYYFPRLYSVNVKLMVPDTYKIVSVPENKVYQMTENVMGYEYIVSVKGNLINIKSNLVINYPVIPEKKYQELRETFDKIIRKQAEKIIVEKK